jgi:hypothetical protein
MLGTKKKLLSFPVQTFPSDPLRFDGERAPDLHLVDRGGCDIPRYADCI